MAAPPPPVGTSATPSPSTTVDDFLATYADVRDGYRRELVDGTILMTPSPGLWHQALSSEIWLAMRTAAHGSAYRPYETPNVKLSETRLAEPDVVLSTRRSADASYLTAEEVVLVCEIVSPGSGSAAADRWLKPRLYAAAGIEWFLRVEPGSRRRPPCAVLYRLDPARGQYVTAASSTDGTITLTEPVPATLDLTVA